MAQYGHTISWPDERRVDETRRHHSSLLSQTVNWGLQWGVLLLSSLLTAVTACAIDIVSNWAHSLKSGRCDGIWYASEAICCMDQLNCPQWKPWTFSAPIYLIASVIFAVAAFFMVAIFPHTAMSGIPELKSYFNGYTMPNLLGNGPLISKSIALTLAVASGLWIGIEGPLVHLATLCASCILGVLKPTVSEARKRDIIMAASAGGVCLAFNAPLGGILFVLEVFRVTDHSVLWKGFVCAMVASFTYEAIDPNKTGKEMFFEVQFDRVWHAVELLFFFILATLAGSLGALTTHFNGVYSRWRREKVFQRIPPVFQVTMIAGVTALLTFPSSILSRSHQVFLRDLYQECTIYHTSGLCGPDTSAVVWHLAYALFVSLVLTVVTYGIAIPAGIILPILLTGAITGRIFGIAMQKWANEWEAILSTSFCPGETECITPGVYALVGAAAALTGATKLTVSSVVITFEMTGALSYIIPIMSGVMVAKWISDSLQVPSIYDIWVQMEGYPTPPNTSTGAPVPNMRGYDVMKPTNQLNIAHLSDSIAQLRQLLRRNVYGFPILNENNQLVGFISRKRLERYLPKDDVEMFNLEDFLDPEELHTLSSEASLLTIKNYMRKLGMHTLLFADRSELQGLITQVDLIRVMDGQKGPPLLHREISYRQSLDRTLSEL